MLVAVEAKGGQYPNPNSELSNLKELEFSFTWLSQSHRLADAKRDDGQGSLDGKIARFLRMITSVNELDILRLPECVYHLPFSKFSHHLEVIRCRPDHIAEN